MSHSKPSTRIGRTKASLLREYRELREDNPEYSLADYLQHLDEMYIKAKDNKNYFSASLWGSDYKIISDYINGEN